MAELKAIATQIQKRYCQNGTWSQAVATRVDRWDVLIFLPRFISKS